ncbi:MAG: OmpA family protein [Bacteroidota bacterium]
MRKFILPMLALLICGLSTLEAQETKNEWAVGVRWIAPNYLFPLDDIQEIRSRDFGGGLQFDIQRYLTDYLYVSLPLHISRAERRTSQMMPDGRRSAAAIGAGLALGLEPIPGQSFFDPQFFAGIDAASYPGEDTKFIFSYGLNLNLRLGQSVYLSPRAEYRETLVSDGDLFDNLQFGLGLFFRPGAPKVDNDRDDDGILNENDACPDDPGPLATVGCPDADGDNIADKDDRCPSEPGPAATQGCPDADGDGIADQDDDCPDTPGLVNLRGCPDADGDGVRDIDDECVNEPGPASNNGCPEPEDADGDGIPDAEDQCPTEPGTPALRGCPDNDGDGIANADDRCPDQRGTARFNGCPDSDSDGTPDPDDRCVNEPGPVSNLGCPEIAEEDITTIEFAIQNVNFESGSATLTASSRDVLDQIADIMRRYPAYSLDIGGHTDSVGSAETNQNLSERRAQSVYNYLRDEAGIEGGRMSSTGYGETQPIADNRNAAGRSQNRRVEFDLKVE